MGIVDRLCKECLTSNLALIGEPQKQACFLKLYCRTTLANVNMLGIPSRKMEDSVL